MMGRSKSLWIKTDYSDVDMLMEEAAEEDDTGVGKCYNILHCTKLMSRKMLFKLHKVPPLPPGALCALARDGTHSPPSTPHVTQSHLSRFCSSASHCISARVPHT